MELDEERISLSHDAVTDGTRVFTSRERWVSSFDVGRVSFQRRDRSVPLFGV